MGLRMLELLGGLIAVGALVAFFGCAPARAQDAGLPETRPKELVISYSWGGGMSGAHAALVVSAGGGTYTTGNHAHDNGDKVVAVRLTEAELDALYRTIRENRLEDMPSHREQMADKGSTRISVSWGEKKVELDTAGKELSTEDAERRFSTIVQALDAVADKAVSAAKVKVVVVLDAELAKDRHKLYLREGRGSSPIFVQEADRSAGKTVLELLPGTHEIQARLDEEWLDAARFEVPGPREVRLSVKGSGLVAEVRELADK